VKSESKHTCRVANISLEYTGGRKPDVRDLRLARLPVSVLR